MTLKTARINVRISNNTKERFEKKAKLLKLDITKFIEKIANEPVIFVDANARAIFDSMK